MPKRNLDTDVDGEWVGRSVMLKPAAARGKRLPETMVAKICRVSRHATNASVLLEYSANGVSKTYTDVFPSSEALSTRYIRVQEAAAPVNKEQFLRTWCFQSPAPTAPRSGRDLSEILPAFQLNRNTRCLPPRWQTCRTLSAPRWPRCSPAPSSPSSSGTCSGPPVAT